MQASTTVTLASAKLEHGAAPEPELHLSQLLELPVGICGPLEVVQLAGKGRGVLATQLCCPGQLLLASPPLAIVQAGTSPSAAARLVASDEEQPPPTAGDLVNLLVASRLTQRQTQLLSALYSGEVGGGSGEQGSASEGGNGDDSCSPQPLRVQQLLQLSAAAEGARLQWGAGSVATAPSTGWHMAAPATLRGMRLPDGRVQVLPPVGQQPAGAAADANDSTPERRRAVTGAVVYNCYGEPTRDEALEQLLARRRRRSSTSTGDGSGARQLGSTNEGPVGPAEEASPQRGASSWGSTDCCAGDSSGFVGLWADFAMLNHSCCPNTINWSGGPHSHMAVIATAPIVAGEEVSVCYFGRELLAPRSVRMEALQRTHNFTCACRRCEHERGLGPALEAAVQGVYDAVNEYWGPRLGAMAEEAQAAAEALRDLKEQQAVLAKQERAQPGALEMGQGQGQPRAGGSGLFGALLCVIGGGDAGGRDTAAERELATREQERTRAAALAALSSVSGQLAVLDQQVAAALSGVETVVAQSIANTGAGIAAPAAEAGWWLRASLYDAYELRVSVAEVSADVARARASATATGAEARSVQEVHAALIKATDDCLQIVAAVAPGSTLHIRLACQLEAAAAPGSTGSAQHLLEAFASRYGGKVGTPLTGHGRRPESAAPVGGAGAPGALCPEDLAVMVTTAARQGHAL
ncbi:hypothetical protein HYH02_005982 [Chlamydomonas schloesseri]|uniref:SET domain-containing protein n=1 Tax=Chlamydomonas schloesseri TaxID=2026947 RepID=A0A835WLI8_9CHLO|nr:hypothetical protein HYH02_005982 [Chlamydomonas schloesseri]|eukprot:KAG2449236.1 hypothetical protein HYH02_005982 [Chlamydomonas schloesseri]